MMKHELEALVGEVSSEALDKIESVYMVFDRFKNYQDIAYFYNKHGMIGIEALYSAMNVAKNEKIAADEAQAQANHMTDKARLTALQFGISF